MIPKPTREQIEEFERRGVDVIYVWPGEIETDPRSVGVWEFDLAGRHFVVVAFDATDITLVRNRIGQLIGRKFVSWDQAQSYCDQFGVSFHDLPDQMYGETYRQGLWALRDIAKLTSKNRHGAMRFCASCRVRVSWTSHGLLDSEERQEFIRMAVRRHFFELPRPDDYWFRWREIRKIRTPYAYWDQKDWQWWIDKYFYEHKGAPACCSPKCELERFSRWHAMCEWQMEIDDKEKRRRRKEAKCIREGRVALQQARRMIQEVLPSQATESTPESTSRAS